MFPLPQSQWVPDSEVSQCHICDKPFIQSLFTSGKHHCRKCGNVVCKYCSKSRIESYRLCDHCHQPGATIIDYIYHSKYIPSSIAKPNPLSRRQPQPHRQVQPQLSQSQSSHSSHLSHSSHSSYSQLQPPSVIDERSIVYIQPVTNHNNYDRMNMNMNINMNMNMSNMECIEYEPSNNDLLKDIEGQNSNDISYKLSSSNSATSISSSYNSHCDGLSGYCPDCDRYQRRKERKRQRKLARRARREMKYNNNSNHNNHDHDRKSKKRSKKHRRHKHHNHNHRIDIQPQHQQYAFVSYPI